MPSSRGSAEKRKQAAVERCEELRGQLARWNHAYYLESQALVPDAEYDLAVVELRELEGQYALARPDSPSVQVGGGLDKKFPTLPHGTPMLSLDNAMTSAHMEHFDVAVRKRLESKTGLADDSLAYAAEPKMDGVALNLTYEHGKLASAATRGDGVAGEDVTANARQISGIPQQLQGTDVPARLEVRGEVYQSRSAFAALNEQRKEAGRPEYQNPRNVASGALRQLDPAATRERRLSFMGYGIGLLEGSPAPTRYSEVVQRMSAWGIAVSPHFCRVLGLEGCTRYYDELAAQRETLDFEMDGVVFKLDNCDLWEALGRHSRAPRWAIAWKFRPQEVLAEVLGIDVQVARTGALTPVARLRPAEVGGVVISNATLHNRSELERKDVRVGDTVWLRRAGEVIPEVLRVELSRRPADSRPFEFPSKCPGCGSKVLAEYCTGAECKDRVCAQVVHFVCRQALNAQGLGAGLVRKLVDHGLVSEPLDLFRLRAADFEKVDGLAEHSAQNLETSLRTAAATSLPRLLYALGVPDVGTSSARRLAEHFGSLSALTDATPEALMYVQGVGAKLARGVHGFFHRADTGNLEERLEEVGLSWPAAVVSPEAASPTPRSADELLDWLQRITALQEAGEGTTWKKAEREAVCRAAERYQDGSAGALLDYPAPALEEALNAAAATPGAAVGALAHLRAPRVQEAVRQLRESGMDWTVDAVGQESVAVHAAAAVSPLSGKTVVLTGTLPDLSRAEATVLIEEAGGRVGSGISRKTDYVLAGERPGGKLKKAEDLGVPKLDLTGFLQMLQEAPQQATAAREPEDVEEDADMSAFDSGPGG